MHTFIKSFFLIGVLLLVSCESLVDDLNDNPNELTLDDVNAELFLTGAQLANNVAQAGHLNRISGLYSGQLIGFTSLYSNIYGYSISTAETVTAWSRVYIGVTTNVRRIRELAPEDDLIVGLSKVMEAHAIGTIASLCGDVPYSEIGQEDIEDPRFDSQRETFLALVALLDEAIADLSGAPSRDLPQDLYYGGDAGKWLEAAHTLQARYYLQLKDYEKAYNAAQAGISSADGTMKYRPNVNSDRSEGDKNLFWMILAGPRTGDIGTGDSYLMQLLDSGSGVYRGNDKTDETARFGYYTIIESDADANLGIINENEPQNLISYQENLLILAETGTRARDFDTGLGHLNDLRTWLNTGEFLNANFINEPFDYQPFVAADFDNGGLENPDGLDPTRALLREIIEERYISGFGTYIPFNDARRLRKSDEDVAVPFPLNPSSETRYPERLPYSDDELQSNSNAPMEPGIFVVTEVNQ